MKIKLLQSGKTEDPFLQEGIAVYEKRLQHYVSFQAHALPALKNTRNLSLHQQKEKEGAALLGSLQPADHVVLLDEKGKHLSSVEFAAFLEAAQNRSVRQLVFIVGGPYGFSDEVYRTAHEKISLSRMTFSHQMVRLFFTEQLYRAYTIIRNEPYHHNG